jgi:hypothetical protein
MGRPSKEKSEAAHKLLDMAAMGLSVQQKDVTVALIRTGDLSPRVLERIAAESDLPEEIMAAIDELDTHPFVHTHKGVGQWEKDHGPDVRKAVWLDVIDRSSY